MKKYIVTYEGSFIIEAEDDLEAEEIAESKIENEYSLDCAVISVDVIA